MKSKIQTEIELKTQINSQNDPKQSWFKKWMLNLIAVVFGFIVICGVLGVLDILAQRELRKTGDALPKLFTYRWKSKNKNNVLTQYGQFNKFDAYDPLNGPMRDLEKVFPNLVEDHLPYVVANYFKIFVRQSCLPNFESHSQMSPRIVTPDLLDKLERPFIVCLGGSTTDPFLPRIKRDSKGEGEWSTIVANGTWCEELSRLMDNKKIRGTVFCGGTGGYTTSNDLMKLLRDVLEIKPDVVISYGGVNDLYMRQDHKMYNTFSYKYIKDTHIKLPKSFIFPNLIRYITREKKQREQRGKFTSIDLYGGIKSELNEPQYMIRNWVIMNEICKLHNIKFYSVCQPCVGSSERTRNDEKLSDNWWKEDYLHDDDLWRACYDVLIKNYDIVKSEIPNYDFMYDFSDIFDNKDLDTIYPYEYDWCHVSQEGNRIVAENMFKMLFGKSDNSENAAD